VHQHHPQFLQVGLQGQASSHQNSYGVKGYVQAFFSLPYLKVETLSFQAMGLLSSLEAPSNVWRIFFADTPAALKVIADESRGTPLMVDTTFGNPDPSGPTGGPTVKSAASAPGNKEDSPTSYDFLDDADSMQGKGGEEKSAAEDLLGADPPLGVPDSGYHDYLDQDDLMDLLGPVVLNSWVHNLMRGILDLLLFLVKQNLLILDLDLEISLS
jgi:hypothetical protein